MFEKLIAQVLNSVLGNFIENLDPAQMKISVTSGNVKLQNMKLKSSLFESLPVPFSLVTGHVGLIALQIPVWNLFSSPLIIEISDVYALVRPKHIKEWNTDVERASFVKSTQSQLEQFEVFSQQADNLKKQDPSSIDKLTQNIIDNIQIKVKNIYFRYEDQYSAPHQGSGKFVVGIMLRELSVLTTTKDWEYTGVITSDNLTYKVAKVSQLTIFMDYLNEQSQNQLGQQEQHGDNGGIIAENNNNLNLLSQALNSRMYLEILEQQFQQAEDPQAHQYILDQFSLEVRLTLNKNPLENYQPTLVLDLVLGTNFDQAAKLGSQSAINLNVHQPQIIRILKLVEYIGYYNEFQKGALAKFHKYIIPQTIANNYIQDYIQWKNLVIAKKKDQAKLKQENLIQFENQTVYSKIVILRKFANKLIEQQLNKKKDEELMAQKVSQKQAETGGIWGFFSSSTIKEKNKQELEVLQSQLQKELEQQEKQQDEELVREFNKLTKDLESTKVITNEELDKMPPDYVKMLINVRAPSLKLGYINEFEQALLLANIEEIVVGVTIGQSFTKVDVSLLQIDVLDKWTGAKAFPYLLETRELTTYGQVVKDEGYQQKQVLIFRFESNKEFKICPFKIYAETQKTLFIIGNMIIIQELIRSISAATKGETLDFSFYKEAATEAALKYMEQGKNLFEAVKSGHYKHTSIDLTLLLTAPTIILPQNVFEPQLPCLVLDTGILEQKSHLVPVNEGTDYKAVMNQAQLYDKYEVKLNRLQLNVLEQGLLGVKDYQKGNGQPLIKDFSAILFFFNCIEPIHPVFPTLELNIVISNLEILFGVDALRIIMHIVDSIVLAFSSEEHDLILQVTSSRKQSVQAIEQEEIETQEKQQIIKQLRLEAQQIKQEEEKSKQQKQDNNEDEDDDEFFDAYQDAIDSEDKINALQESQPQLKINESVLDRLDQGDSAQKTNFKLFFAVQKSQITLKEASEITSSFVLIMLDRLCVELEIDRKSDLILNVAVFKFIIEDIQQLNPIAEQFRMILSNSDNSPQSGLANMNDVEKSLLISSSDFEPLTELTKQNSIMSKSLLASQSYTEDMFFKDTLESESLQSKSINEWELKMFKSKELLDLKVVLSNLTLIFALPTIQKICEVVVQIENLFKDLDKENQNNFIKKLQLNNLILKNMDTVMVDSYQQHVKQKLLNQLNIDKVEAAGHEFKKYISGYHKIIRIWKKRGRQDQKKKRTKPNYVDEKDTILEAKHNSPFKVNKFKQHENNDTKVEEQKSKMLIQVDLNNLQIILPLNARTPTSQIVQLSLLSSLNFGSSAYTRRYIETSTNALLYSDKLESSDNLNFNVNNFSVQTLKCITSGTNIGQQVFLSGNKIFSDENYSISDILAPTNLIVKFDSDFSDANQLTNTKIQIILDPMNLKVGFKDIDFINIVVFKVQNDIVKIFTQNEKQQKVQHEEEQGPKDQTPLKRTRSPVKAKIKPMVSKYFQASNKASSTQLRVSCGNLVLSLNDDSRTIDKQLVYCTIQNVSVEMDTFEQPYTASMFILRKMGINSSHQRTFRKILVNAGLLVNYYNLRSLEFEPLIEPWALKALIKQDAPYLSQNISIHSDEMLNINLTFGMALAVKTIMERVQESLKQANQKAIAEQSNPNVQQQLSRIDSPVKQKISSQDQGFIFVNNTGLSVRIYQQPQDEEDKKQKSILQSKQQGHLIIDIQGDNQNPQFKSHQAIYLQDSMIAAGSDPTFKNQKESKLVDIVIGDKYIFHSVSLDNFGVSSYKSQNAKPAPPTQKDIGIICNIKMDGIHKKVSFESQLIIANHMDIDISIFHGSQDNTDANQSVTILPSSSNKVPISWFANENANSLFIETNKNTQNALLFDNLNNYFGITLNGSQLNQYNSKIVQLRGGQYAAINITGYVCQKIQAKNSQEILQYIISIDYPLMISNLNFRPLEISTSVQEVDTIKIAPKESAKLDQINTTITNSLIWKFYESPNVISKTETLNINISQLAEQTISQQFEQEKLDMVFTEVGQKQSFEMEYRTNFTCDIQDYDEHFEFRNKKIAFSNSLHLYLYPKYVVINRTNHDISSCNQLIRAKTSQNFTSSTPKVKFQTDGYSQSDAFDITTIGLSGKIAFTLKDQSQANVRENVIQKYIPHQVEYGIQIKQAPSPFSKTTFVTIAPRYLIVNQLRKPIVVKQKGLKEQVLVTGAHFAYNFEEKSNKQVMIRQALPDELNALKYGKGLFEDMTYDEDTNWSAAFSIEDIDDFQVSFPANQLPGYDFKWYDPHPENNFRRFVRVVVTTKDDATLLVVLSDPIIPEYQIQNATKYSVKYSQVKQKSTVRILKNALNVLAGGDANYIKFSEIKPKSEIPYAWSDRTQPTKKLVIEIQEQIETINIDKAMKKKQITLDDGQVINIEVRVAGNCKKVKISMSNQDQDLQQTQKSYMQVLLDRYMGQKLNLILNLKGVGLSFIDDQPRELLFLSLYQFKLIIQSWLETRQDGSDILEEVTKIQVELDHLQLDNMINQIMPVVIAPVRPIAHKEIQEDFIEAHDRHSENNDEKGQHLIKKNITTDVVPFIQFNLSLAESVGILPASAKTTRVQGLQFAIQEFIFQMETSIINNNFKFVLALIKMFVNESDRDHPHSSNKENFEIVKLQSKEQICGELDANRPIAGSEMIIHSNKMFIEYIHLGAIKANITFQLERKSFEIDVSDPLKGFGVMNLIYTIMANVANISDSSIRFKELILLDSFATTDMLVKQLGSNYARQGIMQFYRLIGSSNLIGNPIGLVDKLGTGVFEFFSEPTKGLLLGPEEFVGGIGKGVKSLVTNVVSGSMDSVSKISGSLYTMIKNVSGEENVEINKADHAIDGVFKGVKGGVGEIFGGVTGLIYKPIQKTREEGVKGFFKGVGSGVMGAITAPVTATLKAGSQISAGVANTANMVNNLGKDEAQLNIKSIRFRPPRYINKKHVIELYNEDYAYASYFVHNFRPKYDIYDILFVIQLPETNQSGQASDIVHSNHQDDSLLILTEKHLIYLRLPITFYRQIVAPQIIFKAQLKNLKKCEFYQSFEASANKAYVLNITAFSAKKQNKSQLILQSTDHNKLKAIQKLIEDLAPEDFVSQ